MNKKLFSINKIICLLLAALCFLFVTCKEPAGSNDSKTPGNNNNNTDKNDKTDVDNNDDDIVDDDDDDYENPNAGIVRELTFSHDSGLYSAQFSLSITAEGSDIYYTTDGSVPVPDKAGTIKYSAPITVQNRNGQPNVLATPQNSANFYGLPSDRNNNMPAVYYPTAAQVPKATVIRVIAVDSSGKKSDVATKTYFIGDNLSGYGNTRIVSLVSDPDNLVSEDRGIMVRGKESNRWNTTPSYNFNTKGADWERDAYFELFEVSNRSKAALSTGVGIRVRGGWSRAIGQKSFTVYFKEQYGIKNLKNYDLIPKDNTLGTTGAVKADGKTPVEQYKSFMLRNGANDCEYTKFYDVFLQDLLSDRSFATQASVPCIVYLNGEYWGPYNFQERYSDNHTEYKYGVKKENVISYDNGELDDGNPGEEPNFNQMISLVNTNYSAFCDVFDVDNFIDYWASEIYIYNEDWPQNNYRMWRTRTVESGNPYGDKKWRYEMFDTEFALGIYNSGGLTGQAGMDAFRKILYGEYKDHPNNQLFAALIKNPDFCKKFVNTMMDLYNKNFHPDNYLPKLNNYVTVYQPLMIGLPGYFDRWGYPGDNGSWTTVYQNKVDDAKRYLNDIRDAMVNNYLPTYFYGYTGNACNVTLSVTGVSGTTIKINSITPNLAGNWTGKYYSGSPITVTASAAPGGYVFDGWTVTGGSAGTPSAQTTTVTLTGNAQITAKYKLNQAAEVPVTGVSLSATSRTLTTGGNFNITATVAPSNATYRTIFWSSSDPSIASVNNNGTVTAIRSGSATITAATAEGISASCAVTVNAVVTNIGLDMSTLGLSYGVSIRLTAAITPSNAPNKDTRWVSSDTTVATVTDDGTVTAKSKNGTATITVTTVDGGKTATCTVSVKQATVLLDLASELQKPSITSGVISDNAAFDSMFSGLPIGPGGSVGTSGNDDAEYSIITENGVKKLQFIEYAGWTPGVDLYDNQIDFHVGDIIEIKGTYTKINLKGNGVILNTDNWGWDPIWAYWSEGAFQANIMITQEDLNHKNDDGSRDIGIKNNNPSGIRIRSSGVDGTDEDKNWEKYFPDGIGKVILEQVKVYGYRD